MCIFYRNWSGNHYASIIDTSDQFFYGFVYIYIQIFYFLVIRHFGHSTMWAFDISTFWAFDLLGFGLLDFDLLGFRLSRHSTLWDFDLMGFRRFGISAFWDFDVLGFYVTGFYIMAFDIMGVFTGLHLIMRYFQQSLQKCLFLQVSLAILNFYSVSCSVIG